jgi:hypothetical protein
MLSPERYASTPVFDLLQAAAQGKIGVDHPFLHAIVDRPEEAIPDLLRWGLDDHEEDPIDLEDDLIAIFRYLKRPEGIPYFLHVIKLAPDYVPEELVPALLSIRHEALEPLLELYHELEEDQAGDVAFLLAALRIHDPRVLEILVDRLEYDTSDGAIVLGLYGDPAARPALEKMQAEVPEDDAHLRNEIQDAIDQLGRPEEGLEDEFDLFAEYPERAAPVFELLEESERIAMLDNESPEIRVAAAESFVNREVSDEARTALFRVAQNDSEPSVRGAAWEALHDELSHAEIRKAMFARLADPNAAPEERGGALVGLASQATKPDVRPYVDELYADETTHARALEAMWRSLDRAFIEFPPKHLDDPNPEVRRQAIWGTGYLTITSAAERLLPYFQDDDYRADALYAYALSTRHETSKAYIKKLQRKIDELAGGLTEEEEELVKLALDERLMLHGHDPVFFPDPKNG